MTFDPTATAIVNGGSGLLLLAVAIFVYLVAPRERPNLAFALMSGGWGVRQASIYAALSFTEGDAVLQVFPFVTIAADAAYVIGLVLMALWFPSTLARADRRIAVLPALVAGTLCVAGVVGYLQPATREALAREFSGAVQTMLLGAQFVNLALALPGFVLVLYLLAQRYRAARPDQRRERSQHTLLTAAFVTYAAMVVSASAIGGPATAIRIEGFLALGSIVLLAGLWLRNAHVVGGRAARSARNLALYILAVQVVGLVAAIPRVGTSSFAAGPQFGVSRVIVVLVVAYAIVRHQMLGIDVKVRWGISKSTTAAAFIAVFFVASEGAQLFFGDENQWVGLAAAGALVFAISPLQRAADRLAEKAVPVASTSPKGSAERSRREEAYRVALRKFLVDERLSREEELALAELASGLGVSHVRAVELRHAVERESALGHPAEADR